MSRATLPTTVRGIAKTTAPAHYEITVGTDGAAASLDVVKVYDNLSPRLDVKQKRSRIITLYLSSVDLQVLAGALTIALVDIRDAQAGRVINE